MPSPDAEQRNLIGPWPGSNSSVWKQMLLIFNNACMEREKVHRMISMNLIHIILSNSIDLYSNKQVACAAEVQALAQVLKKLTIEPKPICGVVFVV